jgi:hypothetical protein
MSTEKFSHGHVFPRPYNQGVRREFGKQEISQAQHLPQHVSIASSYSLPAGGKVNSRTQAAVVFDRNRRV